MPPRDNLGLDYQDLGNIIGVLGLAWGSLLIGGLSDRLGRRRILAGSIVFFSVCSLLTGLLGGLASLLMVRIVMGVTEGASTPTAVTATAEASRPGCGPVATRWDLEAEGLLPARVAGRGGRHP
ncbi:MFS transporter [Streptomyces sp. NPDC001292]|uniref:MFS transporter n=1 Tax=Streptomyces sp. NPDC001292 TaxID=3364558 RepID=UPI00368A946C